MRLDYNIYFEVAAAFFIMSLILYVQLQYSMNTKRNRMFQKLTILTLAADILDVVTAVTNSNADMVPYWVNMVLNTVYFVSIVLLGTQFYSYAKQFNEDEKEGIKSSIRSNILSLSAFCLFIIILGVNLFTGVVFDFVDGEYVHGVLYFTVYLAPYFLFVISGYEMLRMSKQMPFKQKLAIFMFLFFGSSGAIIQAFFFPDVLLNLFTISLGIVIILFFWSPRSISSWLTHL